MTDVCPIWGTCTFGIITGPCIGMEVIMYGAGIPGPYPAGEAFTII